MEDQPSMYVLDDKTRIAAYLRKHPALHLYELGDLDPFFWPSTTWFAIGHGPDAVCLLYAHPALPTLVMMCTEEQTVAARRLAHEVAPALPDRVHIMASAHLDDLGPSYALGPKKRLCRMMLERPTPAIDTRGVRALSRASLEIVLSFYEESYPENWFDPRMLDTGCYFGAFVDGDLACVAGVHVFSEEQRVAALGNIATAASHRGRGLATRATGALLRHLRGRVDHVGLNVATDNAAAIALYRRLGFDVVTDFFEATSTVQR